VTRYVLQSLFLYPPYPPTYSTPPPRVNLPSASICHISSPCQPCSLSLSSQCVPRLICYSRSLHSNTVGHAARRIRIAQQTTSPHSCPTSCPSHNTCPQTRAHSDQREREPCPASSQQPGHHAFPRVLRFLQPTRGAGRKAERIPSLSASPNAFRFP